MRVIGYSYDADVHCVSCTLRYARNEEYQDYFWGEFTDEDISVKNSHGIIDVSKAIELEIIRDSEGNAIHPMFDYEEWDGERCCECGEELE